MKLEVIKNTQPKQKPTDESKLGFGKIFTDHMLMMKYKEGQGWYDAKIMPYGDIALSPAAVVLHYSQEIFEGLKAYRTADDKIMMFRPWDNLDRMADSAEGLCMAPLDKEFMLNAMYELVRMEKDWIPRNEGTSLYIRPTMIGIDERLGVHPASEYLFYVILSPVGAYYEAGLAPVKIYVEEKRVRAVKGGVGHFKTGGNYAASLYAGVQAEKKGYSQVLWLDGRENKYIEEVGAMNMCFIINGELWTPPIGGSILPGITRRSVLQLAEDMGIKVHEERISIYDLVKYADSGELQEAFGTGTAAVISPVGELQYGDKTIVINNGEMGEITKKMYDTLTGIQYGKIEDKHGWTVVL